MTLADLEGFYESAPTLGPGTRYTLQLDGTRSGRSPGEHFALEAAAWSLTGRNVPGTDRPDVRLIGVRRLEGSFLLEGSLLILKAEVLIDKAGEGPGLGSPNPIRRPSKETIRASANPGTRMELEFQLYGSWVTLFRSNR